MPKSNEVSSAEIEEMYREIFENVQVGDGMKDISPLVRARLATNELKQLVSRLKKSNHGEIDDLMFRRYQATITKRYDLFSEDGLQAMRTANQEDRNQTLHEVWNTCLTHPLFAPIFLYTLISRLRKK